MFIASLIVWSALFASSNAASPSTPSESQSFIVKLKPGCSPRTHLSSIEKLAKVKAGRTTCFDSRVFHGYAVDLTDSAHARALSRLGCVEYVEPDVIISAAILSTQTGAPWGLQAITQTIPFPTNADPVALNYTYEYDSTAGEGVDIYIFDSGVYANHTEFQGRVLQSPVFARYTTTGDIYGHGTHVAGIAAGTRFGVAKKSQIIDVKIITDTGRGFASDIIAGLSWAVSHANTTARPSVFNLSLGGGDSTALDDAVMAVVTAGIHVVVAAGNGAVDASDWSPARVSGAIAVGNVDMNGVRSQTSNYGAPVAVFAPGVNITSAATSGPTAIRVDSGTSMAAPHVAGLVAYLLSLEGPRTPLEMKTRVQSLAVADVLTNIPNGTVNLMSKNTF
ncbi:subtilisin-like protein [Ceratobasidium sp. AG-I]|nr:subtilisin-like protein [Ceratobasidium sp. AG-I]